MSGEQDDAELGGHLYAARFVGDRFPTELGMVAQALAEIVAIEEVTRRLARMIVKRRSGSVPAGFDEKFEMRVNGFAPGSKIAELERTTSTPQLMPGFDEFDQAAEVIAAVHRMAEPFDDIIENLPHIDPDQYQQAFKHVSRLGRTLLPGEFYEYGHRNSRRPLIARCTRQSHIRILNLSEPTTTVRDTTLIGRVVSQNYDQHTLIVKPVEGRQVLVDLNGPLDVEVLSSWAQDKTNIIIRGAGYYSDGDTLTELREPERPTPVNARAGKPKRFNKTTFDALATEVDRRQRGWIDGELGTEPDPQLLSLAVEVAREARQNYRVPYPIIGSTADGNITFDWQRAPFRLGAEFDADERLIEMYCVNTEQTEPAQFASVSLDSTKAAAEIAAFVNWVES